MEEIEINKAEASDADEILEIQKKAFQIQGEIYNDFSIPPLVESLNDINEDFKQKSIFKAVSPKGNILGSCRAYTKDNTCYISRLSVDPKYQSQGIGSRLVKFIEDYYFNRCNRFELYTGNKSRKNLALYKKLGYKVFKTEPYDENSDRVYLEKQNVR